MRKGDIYATLTQNTRMRKDDVYAVFTVRVKERNGTLYANFTQHKKRVNISYLYRKDTVKNRKYYFINA